MNEEDELRRLRFLNSQRLGMASRLSCLIAEAVCGSAVLVTAESRELCAAARLLRAEAARLRLRPPATD